MMILRPNRLFGKFNIKTNGLTCKLNDSKKRNFFNHLSTRFSSNLNYLNRNPHEPYASGIWNSKFTDQLIIDKTTPTIPIFRLMDEDGNITSSHNLELSDQEILEMYEFMVQLSVYDNILYEIQRQGRISFYIQNQGEEALQTGVSKALSIEDNLWCQYRELGVLMWRGFTLDDVLNQCFGNSKDESRGRQMPISYSKKSINLNTISTPLTSQLPHAAGSGYAFKLRNEKKCSVAFFGEGAASEGDFHAAMNFAATLKCQTIFACRNNGYAISTPVVDQYVGDGIAIRGLSYGMRTVRVDGNDIFAVYLSTKECRRICVDDSEPICIEFMTYRSGHHSTSDDSTQYRSKDELDRWCNTGLNPIIRLQKFLERNKIMSKDHDEKIRSQARATILKQIKIAEKIKKSQILSGLFDDVYAERQWHIEEQREGLKEHLKKFKDKYDISKYESL